MTLAQLNETQRERLDGSGWTRSDGWRFRTDYMVGRNGRQNSWRGGSGAKLHLLRVSTVTEKPADARPGTYKVGAHYSVQGVCAANGQHTGMVVRGAELADVTCSRCLKALAEMGVR